jgi:hypothetical protein
MDQAVNKDGIRPYAVQFTSIVYMKAEGAVWFIHCSV